MKAPTTHYLLWEDIRTMLVAIQARGLLNLAVDRTFTAYVFLSLSKSTPAVVHEQVLELVLSHGFNAEHSLDEYQDHVYRFKELA